MPGQRFNYTIIIIIIFNNFVDYFPEVIYSEKPVSINNVIFYFITCTILKAING